MSAHSVKKSVLFKNARLIDGVSDLPLNGVPILLEGERITRVLQGDISVSEDVETIELNGKTVMPGLIETRVPASKTPASPLCLMQCSPLSGCRAKLVSC